MNFGFWSKNGRFVTHMFFLKKFAETPNFIVFLWCALFGPSCQKGKYFLFSLFFSFFFSFCFFWFCCFLCFFGRVLRVMWPPHLALNPPYLFFVCLFFFVGSFPFFVFHRKTLFPPPPKRAFFVCFFSVSVSFSLAFFGLPLFHFLYLWPSLFLYFLPSFLSFFLAFFLFLCFCLFFPFSFFFAFVSWKEQHQNIKLQSFGSSILSHFCWFPLFFFLANSLSLSLFFSWF